MRASTKSLEAALDPAEAARMGDAKLAERVGYWYKPASAKMQEDDAKPVRDHTGLRPQALAADSIRPSSSSSATALAALLSLRRSFCTSPG